MGIRRKTRYGNYMSVARDDSPRISTYKRTEDGYIKLSGPGANRISMAAPDKIKPRENSEIAATALYAALVAIISGIIMLLMINI